MEEALQLTQATAAKQKWWKINFRIQLPIWATKMKSQFLLLNLKFQKNALSYVALKKVTLLQVLLDASFAKV